MEVSLKFGKSNFVGHVEAEFKQNYEIIKELGRGGYGEVYEVKNLKTGEIRACKHLSKMSMDLQRFRNEINIMIQFDHPNIIKLYEIFENEDSFHLIMEECKGGEIFDRITERIESQHMYSEKEAALIFRQIMSAISYCHNNGICHRDIKPENLLYLNEGPETNNPIKVIDFGLSQNKNNLKTKCGSSYYVSPEILFGNYNEKCDIWSAGVILYIILSGEPPFNGSNTQAIYKKIKNMKFEYPENKWKNISNEAKDLINHMLTPEAERYTAVQVLAHPWFKNEIIVPLSTLNFDITVFKNFRKCSTLKKISSIYIASRLNENEIILLRKAFEAIDKCKDGQITFEEFKQCLVKYDKLKEDEIKKLFESIDVDKNGMIDYTEFIAASINRQVYLKNERLYEVFCSLDKDKSGKISKDDIIKTIKCDKIQEEEIEKYIKAVDKNGDGKIDYKEFLELMQNDKENQLENL